MVSNANYLICIFMNFNETIKKGLKSINEQFSCPNHHYDTVIALVIYRGYSSFWSEYEFYFIE